MLQSTAKGFYPPKEMNESNPRWKKLTLMNIPGANVIKSQIKNAHKTLEKTQIVLDRVSQALSTIQSIITLLQKFETILNTGFYTFIDLILDKFEELLHDVRSTGIYFLDLFSYHLQEEQQLIINDQDDDAYKSALGGDAWFNSFAASAATKIKETNSKDIYYLKESYNEFIDVICRAFLDYKDLPEHIDYDIHTSDIPRVIPAFDKIYKTGRPNFGEQGNIRAYLLVIATTDIDELIILIKNLWDIFTQKDFKNWPALRKLLDSITNTPLYKGSYEEIDVDYKYTPSNSEPNFIGINLNNVPILNSIFREIDKLVNKIRGFRYKSNVLSILDGVSSLVDSIQKEIEDIQLLIYQIDKFLTLLDALISLTGIYMLEINSKEGNAGIVKALKNAKGFFTPDSKTIEEMQEDENKIREEQNKAIENAINNYNLLKEQQTKAQQLIQYLNFLKTNTNTWNVYKETMSINTIGTLSILENELNILQNDYHIDISQKQSDIEILQNNENSLSSLHILLENTIIDKNNFINVMDETIESYQLELDNINEQQSNPTKPNVENYEFLVLELTNNINVSESIRDQEIIKYDELINKYESVYNYIYNLEKSEYSNEIVANQNSLASYKIDYQDIEDTYLLNKNNKEQEQSDTQDLLDIAEIDREDIYNNYLDKLAEIQAWQLANPGGTIPQYLINERDALKLQLDNLDEDILELKNTLEQIEEDLLLLKQARDSDLLLNAKQQNIIGLKIEVLIIEEDIYEIELEINNIISIYNEDYGIINNKINSIYTNGYNTILSLQIPTINLFNEGRILISNPTLATYSLAKDENYNIRNPDITRLENVENIINEEIDAINYRVISAENLVTYLQNEENKRRDKAQKEIDLYSSSKNIFDPEKKMYFAGGLMCYGWPGKDEEGKYFNFSKYTKDVYNSSLEAIGENKLQVNNEINLINKLFK